MSRKVIETDVAVIGAGYAGIAAAVRLQEAGRRVAVLEARDRIGGRTLTQTLSSGEKVDLGAQWIGPDQHRVWQWVHATGVETYECHDSGKNLLRYGGRTTMYSGTIPKIDPVSLVDLGIAIERINRMSRQICVESPWTHPKAGKWDRTTVATWMHRNMLTRKARFLFSVGIETVFAADPSELSLLGALFYCRSGKDLDTLISVTGGAQQTLLMNGTQHLLQQVARPLDGRIFTGQPVQRVLHSDTGVTALTNSLEVIARHAVIAVPPALLDRIRFDPILPQRKAQLAQRMPMGAAMKCFCIYHRPFWRDRGWSGQAVTDEAPVKVVFDCSRSASGKGILLVFVEGPDARDFIEQPIDVRKMQILKGLDRLFGPEAARPLEYIDKCWTEEEWTRGCYVGNLPPGVLTAFKDTARRPFGRIRFAGTETATEWNGYLDGAIQSGEREAAVILGM